MCYQDQRLISSFDIIFDNLFYEFLNRSMLYIYIWRALYRRIRNRKFNWFRRKEINEAACQGYRAEFET